MSLPFIGQVSMFAGNYAPKDWAFCDGEEFPIKQNEELFALLGITYGGDGRTTGGLPDFGGRLPLHYGQGEGLTEYTLGEKGGLQTVLLSNQEIPSHRHPLMASNVNAFSDQPKGAVLAHSLGKSVYRTKKPSVKLNSMVITVTGDSQKHSNMQPFLCVNFIIALEGVFPRRP